MSAVALQRSWIEVLLVELRCCNYGNYEFESEDDADEVPECQQWAYTGKCDRAPDGGQGSCKYKHLGTAGYKGRGAIMDAAGIEKAKKAAAVVALFGADDTP